MASKAATEVRGSETALTGPLGAVPTKAAVDVPTGWMGREPDLISSMGVLGVRAFGVSGLEGVPDMRKGYSLMGRMEI